MLLKNYPIRFLERKFKTEKDVMVRERLQMMLYLREGYTQREVSSMLRVSVGIVPYWKKRLETGGIRSLKDKEGRGKKPQLKEKELGILASAIDRGILMEGGYRRGWKTKDARIFIHKQFGITYTPRHCTRLLHKMGYALKVPRPRNKGRNQQKVDDFKREFKKNSKIWTRIP